MIAQIYTFYGILITTFEVKDRRVKGSLGESYSYTKQKVEMFGSSSYESLHVALLHCQQQHPILYAKKPRLFSKNKVT